MPENREPVLTVALLVAAFDALVALLAILFDWDAELVAAIVGVTSAVASILGAVIARTKVTPLVRPNGLDNDSIRRLASTLPEFRADDPLSDA
ncbi:MAG: hypothetical protein ACF8PN_08145 [Phycisphaerales bacterium]